MNLLSLLAHRHTAEASTQLGASEKIQIVIAIATLLAVLVALFQEKIRRWFRKAHLNVVIYMRPPDSHKIKTTVGKDVIYVRIRVEHLKGDPAENVEVMLVRCWEYKNEEKSLKKNFIPLNLTWANRPQKESNIKVPAGLFRYCDLGYLFRYGQNTRFHFDTIVQPNEIGDERDFPNIIGKGVYEIEVWVSGDNTSKVKKSWRIEIDGKWDDSEKKMLSDHLKITEL